MARCVAAGDDHALQPLFCGQLSKQVSESAAEFVARTLLAVDLRAPVRSRAKRRIEDDAAACLQAGLCGGRRTYDRLVGMLRNQLDRIHLDSVETVGHCVPDLPFGCRRATAGHHRDPVDGAGSRKSRAGGRGAVSIPFGKQRVFDARRAGDEISTVPARAPDFLAGQRLAFGTVDVDEQDRSIRGQPVEGRRQSRRPQRGQVEQLGRKVCLTRQMDQEVGFVHRRRGMAAHHRMAVDPVISVAIGGEEMTEGGVAPKLRRTHHQRHAVLLEHGTADLDRPADIADGRARIEGRADFVVADFRLKRLQPGECVLEMRIHPLRGFATACSRQADGTAMREARQQAGVRLAREEDGRDAAELERLHHVGRTGEVVAVVAEEQLLHAQAPLPSANFSIDRASSAWSLANSFRGMSSTAACQACRTARTPAPGPSG